MKLTGWQRIVITICVFTLAVPAIGVFVIYGEATEHNILYKYRSQIINDLSDPPPAKKITYREAAPTAEYIKRAREFDASLDKPLPEGEVPTTILDEIIARESQEKNNQPMTAFEEYIVRQTKGDDSQLTPFQKAFGVSPAERASAQIEDIELVDHVFNLDILIAAKHDIKNIRNNIQKYFGDSYLNKFNNQIHTQRQLHILKYSGYIFGGWFIFCVLLWIIYFTLRWIMAGFKESGI